MTAPALPGAAPDPFDAALAALDVEPTHHTDRMVTTYAIVGLDDVRAAHRAEVERIAARVAKLEAALREAQGALYRASKNLRGAAAFVDVGTDRATIHQRSGDARRAAEAIADAIGTSEDKP